MISVRMYVQKGCPHCEAAKKFFEERNLSVESIEIGFDPILQAGLRSLTGGANFTVPMTISYLTGEVIVGDDPVQLQRVVDSFGPVAPNTAP